jgi:hypothetical protein
MVQRGGRIALRLLRALASRDKRSRADDPSRDKSRYNDSTMATRAIPARLIENPTGGELAVCAAIAIPADYREGIALERALHRAL